jgi:hypothetical protein
MKPEAMTSRPKSSPVPRAAGPIIGPALEAFYGARAMSPHEEVEAALDEYQTCSRAATAAGAQAFARLLRLAEERESGQIVRIARFLAAVYNGQSFPLDVLELRAVDVAISDDMLQCLDALRWGRADLHTLVPDGDRRMQAVIVRWGLRWSDSD